MRQTDSEKEVEVNTGTGRSAEKKWNGKGRSGQSGELTVPSE